MQLAKGGPLEPHWETAVNFKIAFPSQGEQGKIKQSFLAQKKNDQTRYLASIRHR